MSKKINNTTELREVLIEAIQGIRAGKLGAKEASAISSLSNQVLESAKLDLRVAQLQDRIGSLADRPAMLLPAESKTKAARK
jgi:ABC-type bacteriocin/lantibiotic exporter with double-glycine peptidase domain